MTLPIVTIPTLFVVGTDTDVGKTEVVCTILNELIDLDISVGAYKPACSGSIVSEKNGAIWNDVERLHACVKGKLTRDEICPQQFHAPAAPPQAAILENRTVDEKLLISGMNNVAQKSDILIIEGVGGVMSPLSSNWTILDFAREIKVPLLIVGRLGLGTINHTCMTVEVARAHHIPVVGIVLSETVPGAIDPSITGNQAEIEKRSSCPVLGILPYQGKLGLQHLGNPIKIPWKEKIEHAMKSVP